MSRRFLGGMLPALLVMLAVATPAQAQAQDKMKTGLWTGTVFTPDGEVVDLAYDVTYDEDVLGIELILPADLGMGNIPAGNPMLEQGALTFSLEVGESVSCQLALNDDGSYEGECIDSTGGAALMTMIPPEDG